MNEATGPQSRWSLSLRWKVFTLVTALIVVPVTILVAIFAQSLVGVLRESNIQKARSIGKIAAAHVASAIALDDVDTAREAFASIKEDPDLVGFDLYRSDGTLFFSGHPDDAAAMPRVAGIVFDPQYVEVSSAIITKAGPRGVLRLAFATSGMHAAVHEVRMSALYVALAALALGISAGGFAAAKFGRRVARVKERAEEIARGHFSMTPLDDRSGDEIGQMARAFQRMVGNVEAEVRKRTLELEESREQFRKLLESTHAVPWQYDLALRRFTYLGPRAADLFGEPLDTLYDTPVWTSHLDNSTLTRLGNAMRRAWNTGQDGEFEFYFERRDGRQVTLRSVFSVSKDDGAEVLLGFMLDVTRQHELELELRQAQKLESVGRLAAGVAHEINTPLQFVTSSLHFIRDAYQDTRKLLELHREFRATAADGRSSSGGAADGQSSGIAALVEAEEDLDLAYLDDNVPKALERVTEGLGRVTTIVRAMNEFAHPDQGERTVVDLTDALKATLAISRNEYKDVAEIVTQFGEIPRIHCQLGDLNQAFLNIIVNASHAVADKLARTGERGTITVATECRDKDVVVTIEDTGDGIPEAVRTRIFDPFFTTKEPGRGTGQGLAIARAVVVDKHGGSLNFTTQVGFGTKFEIRLPIDSPAAREPV